MVVGGSLVAHGVGVDRDKDEYKDIAVKGRGCRAMGRVMRVGWGWKGGNGRRWGEVRGGGGHGFFMGKLLLLLQSHVF